MLLKYSLCSNFCKYIDFYHFLEKILEAWTMIDTNL